MKIGIDINATRGRKTGLGVYTENLVRALIEEARGVHTIRCFSKPVTREWNTFERLRWENVDLPWIALKDRIHLLHVPGFSPPRVKVCRLVVTAHDLIGMIVPNQLGWPSQMYWSKWLPNAVRRADAIITDSENSKRDILEKLRIPERKIRVVYPSGHEGFQELTDDIRLDALKKRLKIREKYFLCVGTIEPRKNLSRAIRAFSMFLERKKSSVEYQLVIVGSKSFGQGKSYQMLVEESGVSLEDVIFADYLKHEDLNRLYSGAEAFVFPTLYEGFGMPVLEAMGSGTPVLTSNTSSLPEVAGDAAWLVDPCDTEQIAEGMVALGEDSKLRSELIAKGRERIQNFSWKKTARETISVYESLG